MDDASEEDEAADPTRAFEDLRAEVSVLRRAVEALPRAWADNKPPDYSLVLGRVSKDLGTVASHLQAIEQHPALVLTPEEHRRAVARAGEGVMAEAARKLDLAAQGADRERHQLAGLIGVARTKDQQLRALAITAGIALAVGLILSPIVAGVLPFGLNGRIAALVMRADRWHAGEALMQAQSPDSWAELVAGGQLVRANHDALAACQAAAAKAKKAERCTISVSAE
jgi:hypothetical protein